MKTYATKPAEVEKKMYLVDASGQTLGRLASRIAIILMGKNKPVYAPNEDTGDFVIVINAAKVKITGKKMLQKIYYHHSMYPGGMKETTLEKQMIDDPTKVIEHAVFGMIPHTKLGDAQRKKLRVFSGPEHSYGAGVEKISVEDK